MDLKHQWNLLFESSFWKFYWISFKFKSAIESDFLLEIHWDLIKVSITKAVLNIPSYLQEFSRIFLKFLVIFLCPKTCFCIYGKGNKENWNYLIFPGPPTSQIVPLTPGPQCRSYPSVSCCHPMSLSHWATCQWPPSPNRWPHVNNCKLSIWINNYLLHSCCCIFFFVLIWAVIFYFANRRRLTFKFDLNSNRFANYKKFGIEKVFL
jgi:hypothetical protein